MLTIINNYILTNTKTITANNGIKALFKSMLINLKNPIDRKTNAQTIANAARLNKV